MTSATQWDRGGEERGVRGGITAFPLPGVVPTAAGFLLLSGPNLCSMERHTLVELLEKSLPVTHAELGSVDLLGAFPA